MSARRAAWLVALALAASATTADARPRKRDAKQQFDRGLAAYKKGNFEAASQALARSYDLEPDIDTLFAWAQAQRKLEHCDRAIELYEKLLGYDLPAANREAVERSLADCRAILASLAPPPVPEPLPVVSPPTATHAEPAPVAAPAPAAPRPEPAESRGWYRDPVALTLVGSGLITAGVGAGLLVSAHALDRDFHNATTDVDAEHLASQARTRGNAGLITAGAGGALLIGGIIWIATHRAASEPRTITAWFPPGGAGLALTAGF